MPVAQKIVPVGPRTGRVQYSGPAMAAAKAVVDAAQGGMVLISPGIFQQVLQYNLECVEWSMFHASLIAKPALLLPPESGVHGQSTFLRPPLVRLLNDGNLVGEGQQRPIAAEYLCKMLQQGRRNPCQAAAGKDVGCFNGRARVGQGPGAGLHAALPGARQMKATKVYYEPLNSSMAMAEGLQTSEE
eukprot:1151031-Pelagomonas_calceolata.AAC.4